MPYSNNGYTDHNNNYNCDGDCDSCYYRNTCDNSTYEEPCNVDEEKAVEPAKKEPKWVQMNMEDLKAEMQEEQERLAREKAFKETLEEREREERNLKAQEEYLKEKKEREDRIRSEKTRKQEIKQFVQDNTNALADNYYRLNYDKRRLIKYRYYEEFLPKYKIFITDKDEFYISRKDKGLEEAWKNLPSEKKDAINDFVYAVKKYDAEKFLALRFKDDYKAFNLKGNLFSEEAIRHIDGRVQRGENRKYEVLPEYIEESTCQKEEIINDYNEYKKANNNKTKSNDVNE